MPPLKAHKAPTESRMAAPPASPMASSLRSRSWNQVDMDEDPAADGDSRSFTEGSSFSSSDGYESELESMTGKGIKRLCSELLELKKASDEDFQRNLHSNLPAFLRIYQVVGGMEGELMSLKQHVLSQKKLVQNLMSNLYLEKICEDTVNIKPDIVEDLDPCLPSSFGVQRDNILETLDILLSEHQIQEALIILENETVTLQKSQIKEHVLPSTFSYMSAISDRRTKLADQFTAVAEHPRTAQPEFQKALSGLCRLGENNQATTLLLNFYRSRLKGRIQELHCTIPLIHATYIRELSKIVFSAICQAAMSFNNLYGGTFVYTSNFIQWAREETKSFSQSFDLCVKSISKFYGSISLAVESVNSALTYCDLLKSQKIVLQPYLITLIRPCIEDIVQMHMYHLKKVVSTFKADDTWVLSKFLISGILRDRSYFTEMSGETEYCLLTSSGRQFIILMQEIVDDISPLVILQTESSIHKGLTDLFNEYIHTLEEALPNRGNIVDDDSSRSTSAQKLQQQISLLVNSSTLVYFFPVIANSIFRGIQPSNNELSLEHTEHSLQHELDGWMLSILESVDQLRGCFCQQFVHDIMSHGESYLEASLESDIDEKFILSSTEVPMPSFGFQALFLQLRQLDLYKSILAGEDGLVKMLLVELMETVVVWLSNNQDFWKKTKGNISIPQISCFEQVHIDMHFLLEIAKCGGYFSDDILAAALDLIAQITATCSSMETEPNSVVPDDNWASKAAKMAIEKLLEVEVAESDTKEKPASSLGKGYNRHIYEVAGPNAGVDATDTSEDYTDLGDGESAESAEEGTPKSVEIKIMVSESLEVNAEYVQSDDEGLRSPTIHIVSIEDGLEVTKAEASTEMRSDIVGMEESDIEEEPATTSEVNSTGNLVGCVTNRECNVIDKSQETVITETSEAEAEYSETPSKVDATAVSDVIAQAMGTRLFVNFDKLDTSVVHCDNSERTVLEVESRFPAISDKPNIEGTMVILDELTLFPYSEVDGGPSSSKLEGTDLDHVNTPVVCQRGDILSSTDKSDGGSITIFENHVQDDGPRVSGVVQGEDKLCATYTKTIETTSIVVEKVFSTTTDGITGLAENILTAVPGKPDITKGYSDQKVDGIKMVLGDLNAASSSKNHVEHCSVQLEANETDSENEPTILQRRDTSVSSDMADSSPTSEEVDQYDSSRRGGEISTDDGRSSEARVKNKGAGSANQVARSKFRRGRPINSRTEGSLEKNRTGPKSTRPKWH